MAVPRGRTKGERRYPYGIRRKNAEKNRNNGHAADHTYGRLFGSQSCPECGFVVKSNLGKPARMCPSCKAEMPRNGYR